MKLSVVMPVAPDWSDMLRWTLESYNTQTSAQFEVLIIEDGEPSPEVKAVAERDWNFPVKYFCSPRENDKAVAHKNHARNVGWRNAGGEAIFFSDCDFMVEPHFVSSVLNLYEEASALGDPFCLYPPCAILDSPPTSGVLDRPAHRFDSFLTDYKSSPETKPKLKTVEAHPEGMHLLSRELVTLLGGFDEDFIGWGHNKMEFQTRINECAISQFLLDGCLIYHQPHERLSDPKTDEAKTRNREISIAKRSERDASEAWGRRRAFIANGKAEQSEQPQDWLEKWFAGGIPPQTFSENPDDWRIHKTILREDEPGRPILFIGPWVGEFGWEVARWQGGIRRWIENTTESAHYHIIACGDAGHHPLYSDYVHEFWSVPSILPQQSLTRESHTFSSSNDSAAILDTVRHLIAADLLQRTGNAVLLEPVFETTRAFARKPNDQLHRKLTPTSAAIAERDSMLLKSGMTKWICIFPRQRQLRKEKNWNAQHWNALTDFLHTEYDCAIVVMGRPEDSANIIRPDSWFQTTMNLRPARRMDVAIAFLSDALGAVSCESGGPYLSLLCGCPTLVMGGPEWRERYEVNENFIGTKCTYLESENFNHPYHAVESSARKFFNHTEKEVAMGSSNKVVDMQETSDGRVFEATENDNELDWRESTTSTRAHDEVWKNKFEKRGSSLVTDARLTPEEAAAEGIRWEGQIEEWLEWKTIDDLDGGRFAGELQVLDIGCGWGRFFPLLDKIFDYYTGLDILEPLIDEAKTRYGKGDFRTIFAGEPLPLEDDSVDLVFCCTVVQHITDPKMLDDFILEIKRVLTPGGRVFLFENVSDNKSRIDIAFRSVDEYRGIFETFGFGGFKVIGELSSRGEAHAAMIVSSAEPFVETKTSWGGIVGQTEPELERACEIVKEESTTSYLEIGTHSGGTLIAFGELCAFGARIIAIDPAFKASALQSGAHLMTAGYDVWMIRGKSHDMLQTAALALGGFIDCLVIDGDHTEGGLTQDWRDYYPLVKPGGLVLVHDIANSRCSTVGREWQKLKDGKTFEVLTEIVIAGPTMDGKGEVRSMGWGVARKPK